MTKMNKKEQNLITFMLKFDKIIQWFKFMELEK